MSNSENKKSGNRKPSPRLFNITKKWTANEWRMIAAFSEVLGKGSQKVRLLKLLRYMEDGYDVELEKKSFSDQNLSSLRYDAIQYSYNIGRKLDFIERFDLAKWYGNIELAIQKESFTDALEFLSIAKRIALERDEFLWLQKFLLQETEVAKHTSPSDHQVTKLKALAIEEKENLKRLSDFAEIRSARAFFLEGPKTKLIETGTIDVSEVQKYFDSSFYQSFPSVPRSRLLLEKLRLDQLAFYLLGNYEAAVLVSENIVSILEDRPALLISDPEAHSKELMNLAAYYSRLGNMEKLREIITRFEKTNMDAESTSNHFIINYLWVIFQVSFDGKDWELGRKGASIWKKHRERLLASNMSNTLKVLLLYVSFHFLVHGELESAKAEFLLLYNQKKVFDRAQLLATYMILHMALLSEENDERGLESMGRNYKRKLKAISYDLPPIIEIITVLRKHSSLLIKTEESFSKEMSTLQVRLKESMTNPKYERSLLFGLITSWIETKIHVKGCPE